MHVKNSGVCFVGTSGGSINSYDSCVVNGKIYVCSAHRISIFDAETLEYISYFGSFGSGDGQFSTPTSICSDGTYLYVADFNNYRIQKFSLDGGFVSKIGSNGSGNNEFNKPHCIRYYDGKLYIADRDNNRINIRSALDLSFIENLPLTYAPYSCWIDSGKQVILTGGLYCFDIYSLLDYSLIKNKTGLSGGAGYILMGDYIFHVEYNNHRIARYNYDDLSNAGYYQPGQGSLPGQLSNPYHLNFWPERNLILISNSGSPYYVVGITPELEFKYHAKNRLIFDIKDIK